MFSTIIMCEILTRVRKIPTFFLAFKSMHPELRNKLNIVFSVTFFITRILLHIILGVSYSLHDNRTRITDGSYMPSLIMAMVFPLHAMWFYESIKGFIRRAARRRTPVSTTVDTPPVNQKVDALPESQQSPVEAVPVVKPSKISKMLGQPIPFYHPAIIRSLNVRSFTLVGFVPGVSLSAVTTHFVSSVENFRPNPVLLSLIAKLFLIILV